jgi:hypothetical protein
MMSDSANEALSIPNQVLSSVVYGGSIHDIYDNNKNDHDNDNKDDGDGGGDGMKWIDNL